MPEPLNTWEQIDFPVLRFVDGIGYDVRWRFGRRGPTAEMPGFDGEQVDDALRRLQGHGLITWGQRSPTVGSFSYTRLRPTPDGLRVLGEWPPAEQAQFGAALVHLLGALADEADGEDVKSLRRAAGAVGRFTGSVVFDVAKGELGHLGGEASG